VFIQHFPAKPREDYLRTWRTWGSFCLEQNNLCDVSINYLHLISEICADTSHITYRIICEAAAASPKRIISHFWQMCVFSQFECSVTTHFCTLAHPSLREKFDNLRYQSKIKETVLSVEGFYVPQFKASAAL
jgi:hypothetical protein